MPCEEETLRILADAGCGEALIRRYGQLAERTDPEARRQRESLLAGYRAELLAALHEAQFRLECLDFLLFRLRGGEPPRNRRNGRKGT